MSANRLRDEVEFGLANLDKIHLAISGLVRRELEQRVKVSALAYEGLGYYNVLEHLMIRILKHLGTVVPSGPFFHRDVLRQFEALAKERRVEAAEKTLRCLENLMAFRHVATKIYGFLIDWNKLEAVLKDMEENHEGIKRLLREVRQAIE